MTSPNDANTSSSNNVADVSSSTRRVVDHYLAQLGSGAPPEKLAELFSEDVDWYIAGDIESVPWLGRRHGRAGVADFFTLFRKGVQPVRLDLEEPLVNGERAVILGAFDSLLTASGRVVTSEGAIVMRVRDGLIVQYRVLEDSHAVSQTQRT